MLVVDDEAPLLELTHLMLKTAGFSVLCASSAAECRETLLALLPDLILLDINLPDLCGFDLCHEIKQNARTAGIAVMYFSGAHISSEEQALGLNSGADGYIVRPITQYELIARVEAMLRVRRTESELRRVTEELRLTSRVLQQMMDYSLDSICMLDASGAFLEVSAAAEQMWGYKRNELIGKRFLDLVHPGDVERSVKMFASVQDGVPTRDFENRFMHPAGGSVMVMWSAYWSEIDRKMFCVARDVTEARVTERVPQRTATRLQTTLECLSDAFYLLDRDYCFTFVNPAAERLLNCPREEILYRCVWDAFPAANESALREEFEQCMATGKSSQFELFLPAFRRWFEVNAFSSDGGLAVYFRDVTERKSNQNLLAESNETFLQFAENVSDAFWIMDSRTRKMLYVNSSFRRMYGGDSPVGFLDAVHPEDRERVEKASENLTTRYSEEHRLVRADGSEIWVWARMVPVHDAEGRVIRIAGINTDITERKCLERQILRAQRLESIGTLAGGIAHDLNNVLTPIIMSMGLLRLQIPDAEAQNTLDTIETSAHRGADMVRQVLSFAKGVESERVPMNVRDLLKEIHKIVAETFPKNIELKISVKPGLWSMWGDPTQIHQVLLNLCVNARDAMPNGGQICITVRNEKIARSCGTSLRELAGRYVRIDVEDTGCGIPPNALESIFDPFYTTKEVGRGSGLGLSTSLAIAKSHGGFIQVSSEVGRGTTFTVNLLASEDSIDVLDSLGPRELPRGSGETILLVEDEAPLRSVAQQTLEAFGYRVLSAVDGAEAVAVYARHQDEIDAVITDMTMPIMDGAATIEVLTRINR
ncbi:MAG TPA: PAS domain S-box protein, partial [Chthoniobacteraceae bacterium]|nr:PAS domain S-box protein [Chthoniobacteraceae bacterium]